METLPEKKNNLPVARENAVAILYSGTAKAIDVRRAMVELPEVAKALTTVEKYIFAASTKKQIAEIDDETLIAKPGKCSGLLQWTWGLSFPRKTGTIGRIFVHGYWIYSNAIIRN